MNMNVKQLIIAVAALTVATAAFADQNETRVASGKTRAEVIAELQQAQKDGTAPTYSFVGITNPAAAAGNGAHPQNGNAIPTGKTRAEVAAELKQSDSSSTPAGFVAFDRPATVSTGAPNTAVAHK
jgi:hypothetical protein